MSAVMHSVKQFCSNVPYYKDSNKNRMESNQSNRVPPCPVEPGSLPGCSTGVSSERLSGNQVQRMQEKRILGTVGRSLLIAKRS